MSKIEKECFSNFLNHVECDDFEVESENSDAECFQGSWVNSKQEVIKNPKLCDICVYSKKHSHHTYQSWIDYRNEIGILSNG